MCILPQAVVDHISTLEDAARRIIAVGVDPNDRSLIFVTAAADVMQISPNGKRVPAESRLSYDGRHISVRFEDSDVFYAIDSSLATQAGTSCMSNTTLAIGDTVIGNLEVGDVD